MSDHACTTVRTSAAGTTFDAVFGAVTRMVRGIRREMEIARASRAMEEMPDHMLRDMGIERDQIDVAARFGREHGRRYL